MSKDEQFLQISPLEIKYAIKDATPGKISDVNEIPVELLKAFYDKIIARLTRVLNYTLCPR